MFSAISLNTSMKNKITVIYIISDRRSGSTLLENMLSKSEETVSVGELAMMRDHICKEGPGIFWDWNCSCGQPILQCEFWGKVLDNVYDDTFETKINWSYQSLEALSLAVLPLNAKATLHEIIHTPENIETIKKLNEIYTAVASCSGKKTIVDSSKDPMQALAIRECKNLNVKYILLSRDLRAITFSKLNRWKINKRSDKGELETLVDSYLYKKTCATVFRNIDKNNAIKVSYEVLANNPQRELDRICDKLGLQKFAAPEYMELANDHTIGGTPGRFEKKPITEDNVWKQFYSNRVMLNTLGKVFNAL